MTATPSPPTAGPRPEGRPADDLRLARIHLRMGQLMLARAELEDLLGRDALDTTGLAVLAEARWRTGDTDGAAFAAEAHLEAGGADAIAICIAAEAAAAEGRPGDARVLMDRMPHADAATLDAIFAGMPRRASWPAGPVDQSQLDEIRRETERGAPGTHGYRVADAPPTGPGVAPGLAPGVTAGRGKAGLDPRGEVQRARAELDQRPEQALLRLALALRADPTLAPLVLDAVHMRREPAAVLLRGDAERLLGRHLEAEAAFDSVAESLEP